MRLYDGQVMPGVWVNAKGVGNRGGLGGVSGAGGRRVDVGCDLPAGLQRRGAIRPGELSRARGSAVGELSESLNFHLASELARCVVTKESQRASLLAKRKLRVPSPN
jgi:hypothetical protein